MPKNPAAATWWLDFFKNFSSAHAYRKDTLYVVRVPKARALPPTSFRFCLTADTLVFG